MCIFFFFFYRKAEKSDAYTTRTSNRPSLAPKPKFDVRNTSVPLNDEKESVERVQKTTRMDNGDDCLGNVARRLQKIGTTSMDDSSSSSKLIFSKNFASKGHGHHWSAHLDSGTAGSTGAQNASSSNESESGSVVVNTTTIAHDELSSSSPSSSGIVADMNDSNGESNQRTSATSSLSSCEPSTDLAESNFDASRTGKTCRSRIDDPLASVQDLRGQRQSAAHFNSIEGAVGTVQRSQLERTREPCDLVISSMDEKNEPSNKSILQGIFNSSSTHTSPANLGAIGDTEPRFNLSLNLNNNQRSFTQRSNRSSSIPPERYTAEDRFKRSESSTPELANQRRPLESGGNNPTNEENIKKQIICSKLVEHYRNIENSVDKLDKCTAARAWRQPHILQQHIYDIREHVGVIANSMNGFLDAACRIVVDIINPKSGELKQLLLPLKSSTAIITQLKQNLDSTGWTLGALSRPRNIYGTLPGSDALDQFLAVIKQLPIDCCKLIQWALLMVPSSGVRFLTNGLKDSLNCDSIFTSIYQSHDDSLSRMCETNGRASIETDLKRQSATSINSTMTISSLNDTKTPQSILASRTTFVDPLTNATTETTASTTTNMTTSGKQNRVTFADDLTTSHRLSDSILEAHILEEDDLESVISDRDSFYQESTIDGEDTVVGCRRMRAITNLPPLSLLNAEVIKSLSNDDRQLIEFYSPQLDAHTEFLSKAIEEFLTVIEEQMPPHEFVQKGKLIILTAHKLIYMADTIAECISSGDVSKEVKRAADRLLDVLKTCVQATKHAADEYLSVSAVQSMANCIVTVSRAAYDLKLLVKQCCSNG
uniref:CAS family C-terminal domain-containing protein n=1 Tax=Elaeophora elaphi TaxID=1147741 RepID=A0A0R3RGV9_9BILA